MRGHVTQINTRDTNNNNMIRSRIEFSEDNEEEGINLNSYLILEISVTDGIILDRDGLSGILIAFKSALDGIGFDKKYTDFLTESF